MINKLYSKEVRSKIRKSVRAHFYAGMNRNEITAQLIKEGFAAPDGSTLTVAQVTTQLNNLGGVKYLKSLRKKHRKRSAVAPPPEAFSVYPLQISNKKDDASLARLQEALPRSKERVDKCRAELIAAREPWVEDLIQALLVMDLEDAMRLPSYKAVEKRVNELKFALTDYWEVYELLGHWRDKVLPAPATLESVIDSMAAVALEAERGWPHDAVKLVDTIVKSKDLSAEGKRALVSSLSIPLFWNTPPPFYT